MGDGPDTNGVIDPGISIRFGPVQSEDKKIKDAGNGVNDGGVNKRKTRGSIGQKKSYAEPESSEEDEPLVGNALHRQFRRPPPFIVAVVFLSSTADPFDRASAVAPP